VRRRNACSGRSVVVSTITGSGGGVGFGPIFAAMRCEISTEPNEVMPASGTVSSTAYQSPLVKKYVITVVANVTSATRIRICRMVSGRMRGIVRVAHAKREYRPRHEGSGMTSEPRRVVENGYDVAADAFEEWLASSVTDTARSKYLEAFMAQLEPGARVLELGCGGGGITTQRLASRHALTGIDVSSHQIELARVRVPYATFLKADMSRFVAEPASYDGIAAFYSLIHLPLGVLPSMLERIASWLRPGGVFLANLGASNEAANEHFERHWLADAPMYWSGYGVPEYERFLADAGLEVIEASVETNIEDGEPAPFWWVLARRPGEGT